MSKENLALNNLQWLYAIKPKQTNHIYLIFGTKYGWFGIKPNQTKPSWKNKKW